MCHSRLLLVLTALVSTACGGSTFEDVRGSVGGSAGASGDVGTGGVGQGNRHRPITGTVWEIGSFGRQFSQNRLGTEWLVYKTSILCSARIN